MSRRLPHGCPVCMAQIWMQAPATEGAGGAARVIGITLSFTCSAEYYYPTEGAERVIKKCPEANTLFDETRYRNGA